MDTRTMIVAVAVEPAYGLPAVAAPMIGKLW